MLVWELGKLGITTTGSLEDLITRRLPDAIEQDRAAVEQQQARSAGDVPHEHASFFTHTGLLTIMLEREYGIGFHSRIFEKVEAELGPTGKENDA
jgi:hypothetical protein